MVTRPQFVDPEKRFPYMEVFLLLLILILLSLSSCVTYNKCKDKFGDLQKPQQVIAKGVLDSTLAVISQAQKIQGSSDSICAKVEYWKNKHSREKGKNDSLLMQFGNQKLQTKLWYDRFTNSIKGETDKAADTVFIHLHDTVHVVADCPPAMVFDKEASGFAKFWKEFQFFATCLLLGGIVAAIVYFNFKPKKIYVEKDRD